MTKEITILVPITAKRRETYQIEYENEEEFVKKVLEIKEKVKNGETPNQFLHSELEREKYDKSEISVLIKF